MGMGWSGVSDSYYGGMSGEAETYYGGVYGYRKTPAEIRDGLSHLTERLRHYDRKRLRLEREGGETGDLRELTHLLRMPVIMGEGPGRRAALANQQAMRNALWDLDGNLHLQVRSKATRMPVYFLCRTKSDYWSQYSLVVEDYHVSPGYPMVDDRFVRLMHAGREQDYLRLSRFRSGLVALLQTSGRASDGAVVDEKLHLLGRHVFQAAWHRDQQVGVLSSRSFAMPRLAQAVELLYLCLSGELCELRSAVDQLVPEFFEQVYPQPAIGRFLAGLPAMSGRMLTDLPKRALALYGQLARAFSRFLAGEVSWPMVRGQIPLWKLVYANLGRLDTVAGVCLPQPAVRRAAALLDEQAEQAIERILERPK